MLQDKDAAIAANRRAVADETLRAAAPDLLKALIALRAEVEETTRRCGWSGNGARAMADAAIAKAGG